MYLDADTFKCVVANAPLFAIDLVVEDERGHILLGLRRNRPAQGYWFVPGGRVRKDERLDAAFMRLTREELGYPVRRQDASLLDIYEHLYPDSVFGEEPSTHYVVAAYHLRVVRDVLDLPIQQHSDYRWYSKERMRDDTAIHANSRVYLERIEGGL